MVYAVDFDDAELVSFDPEVLGREGGHVDDAQEVGAAGLDGDLEVLRIVHKGGLGDF